MLREKPLDRSAFVNRGIVEDHDEQRLGKPLVELVEERQEHLGRAPLGPLPIEALGAEMQGAKQRGTLALGGVGTLACCALAKPAALDVGLIGKV